MRVVEIKKLYNGLASVRDYIIKDCLAKNEDLVLNYKDKQMILKADEVEKKMFQLSRKKFRSRYGGMYELYDVKFKPNAKKEKQLEWTNGT